MKMGVREFRERLSEVARGSDPVAITSNSRQLGVYYPEGTRLTGQAAWLVGIESAQAEAAGRGVDLDERLRSIGLTPDGEPVTT